MIPEMSPLIGSSEIWHTVLSQVSQLAAMNRPVLIVGERGTGKELIANRLHYLSQRWQQPYIQINCAAMSETLLESELFGHERGAFTGAIQQHTGLFERADTGTLFLDELATASLPVQEKLLRIIEYGRFERLGGHKTIQIDVRLIAACHADLPLLAAQGHFREDLLDRLAFDVINLPPLRYRQEDIVELADHFALRMCQELGFDYFAGFTPAALQQLQDYQWPGNVRELKNVVERSIYRFGSAHEPVSQIMLDPFACPWRPQTIPPSQRGSVTSPHHLLETSDNHTRIDITRPLSTEPLEHRTELSHKTADGDNRADLKVTIAEMQLPFDLKAEMAAQEQAWIGKALALCHYQQAEAARQLGLTYDQLRAAIRRHPQLQAMINGIRKDRQFLPPL